MDWSCSSPLFKGGDTSSVGRCPGRFEPESIASLLGFETVSSRKAVEARPGYDFKVRGGCRGGPMADLEKINPLLAALSSGVRFCPLVGVTSAEEIGRVPIVPYHSGTSRQCTF